jgi:hypothetical protein
MNRSLPRSGLASSSSEWPPNGLRMGDRPWRAKNPTNWHDRGKVVNDMGNDKVDDSGRYADEATMRMAR